MANKVEFGMKNVHMGSFEDTAGVVTLGQPLKITGAVGLTLDAESELYQFFADDGVYYSDYSDNGESGDLTMALFPDTFKEQFLGYLKLDDGGVAKIKGAKAKNLYLAFEGDGDKTKRRHILYNVAPGSITREYRTIEGQKEVLTEILPVTVNGDNATLIVKVSYNEADAGYDTLFTTPPVPKLPTGLGTLTVTSVAGTSTGDTKITVTPELTVGNKYKYKTDVSITLPALNDDLTAWTDWDGSADITAATGNEIAIAEVTSANLAKKAGKATVASAA